MTEEQKREYRLIALQYAKEMQWINRSTELIAVAEHIYNWIVEGEK